MKRLSRGALASLMVIGLGLAATACGDDDDSPDVTVDLTSVTTESGSTVGDSTVTTMTPGSDSTTGSSVSGGASNNGGGSGVTASTTK